MVYRAVFRLIVVLTICVPPIFGQTSIRIPFVSCKSDGQTGPYEGPKEEEVFLPIDPNTAGKLAYYESAVAPGVLAPRGWYCFGLFGSSGSMLFVQPKPSASQPLPTPDGTGPLVMIAYTEGQGSGRFEVAEVVARLFPKHIAFVRSVVDLFDEFASEVKYGPLPTDKLTYRSDEFAEYLTPSNTIGTGTRGWVKPSADAVEGLAALQGDDTGFPNLLFLTVRLPPGLKDLSSHIIQQVERKVGEQTGR